MKTITCPECEGKGWTVTYGWNVLPEQEQCEFCGGETEVEVTDEFAEYMESNLNRE